MALACHKAVKTPTLLYTIRILIEPKAASLGIVIVVLKIGLLTS